MINLDMSFSRIHDLSNPIHCRNDYGVATPANWNRGRRYQVAGEIDDVASVTLMTQAGDRELDDLILLFVRQPDCTAILVLKELSDGVNGSYPLAGVSMRAPIQRPIRSRTWSIMVMLIRPLPAYVATWLSISGVSKWCLIR